MLSTGASDLFTFLIELNVAVFGVLALALVVILVRVRARNARRTERDRRLVATWRPIFTTAYTGMLPASFPAVDERDWFSLLALFAQFQDLREHDIPRAARIAPRLRSIAEGAGLKVRALSMIEHGDGAEKLLGLKVAGNLRDRDALAHALRLCNDESAELSRAAAHCALLLDAKQSLPKVLHLLAVRDDWSRSRVESMLRSVPVEQLSEDLPIAIEVSDDVETRRLLDYVRLCSPASARSVCGKILAKNTHPETQAAALRSLAPLAAADDRATALRFCNAREAMVAIAALRVLRRCASTDDRAVLALLLAHRDYWVRLRAAEVLVGLFPSDEAVETFARTLHDPFARDAIKQALTERRSLAGRISAPDRRGAHPVPEPSS